MGLRQHSCLRRGSTATSTASTGTAETTSARYTTVVTSRAEVPTPSVVDVWPPPAEPVA